MSESVHHKFSSRFQESQMSSRDPLLNSTALGPSRNSIEQEKVAHNRKQSQEKRYRPKLPKSYPHKYPKKYDVIITSPLCSVCV